MGCVALLTILPLGAIYISDAETSEHTARWEGVYATCNELANLGQAEILELLNGRFRLWHSLNSATTPN